MSAAPVRVLVAGLGNMGRSHALAYHREPDYEIVGLVSRGGSSCLSTGDKLVTDARYNDGSCSIRRIYKWNKDAVQAGNGATAG